MINQTNEMHSFAMKHTTSHHIVSYNVHDDDIGIHDARIHCKRMMYDVSTRARQYDETVSFAHRRD